MPLLVVCRTHLGRMLCANPFLELLRYEFAAPVSHRGLRMAERQTLRQDSQIENVRLLTPGGLKMNGLLGAKLANHGQLRDRQAAPLIRAVSVRHGRRPQRYYR